MAREKKLLPARQKTQDHHASEQIPGPDLKKKVCDLMVLWLTGAEMRLCAADTV